MDRAMQRLRRPEKRIPHHGAGKEAVQKELVRLREVVEIAGEIVAVEKNSSRTDGGQ